MFSPFLKHRPQPLCFLRKALIEVGFQKLLNFLICWHFQLLIWFGHVSGFWNRVQIADSLASDTLPGFCGVIQIGCQRAGVAAAKLVFDWKIAARFESGILAAYRDGMSRRNSSSEELR